MAYGPASQRVRFERSAAPGEIAEHLTMLASQHFIIVANEIRDEIVSEINSIVASELVTDRDGVRRKKGHRHLLGSFQVDVTPTANNFPIKIVVRSKAERKKVAALEFGSPGHSIYPDKPYLYFPYNPEGPTRGNAYRARGTIGKPKIGSRGGTGTKVFLAKLNRPVEHPGNKAYGFMRRGTERVVQRRLH